MHFTKMHGAGNDYIYFDCFAQPAPANPSVLARRMSNRHFGVGSDGLILICPSEMADAEMRMFNVDGSPGEMCGNGIRCVAKYVYDHGIAKRERLAIASAGTIYELDVSIRDGLVHQVRVDMGEPIFAANRIPTTLTPSPASRNNTIVGVPLDVDGREIAVTALSMGNPHCVVFVDKLTDDWVLGTGPQIETHACFPDRVNVEFARIASPNEIHQRTWERGSGETLACGSGASAVCVAGVLTGQTERKVLVHLPGGDLELEWCETTNHVFMTGPAEEVFTGKWGEG